MPAPISEMIQGLLASESLSGDNVFTWQGTDYNCVPSITTFTRELEAGGFSTEPAVNLSVRLLDEQQNSIFPGALPDAQQTITFQTIQYRILTAKPQPNGVYMRILAVSTTRGI